MNTTTLFNHNARTLIMFSGLMIALVLFARIQDASDFNVKSISAAEAKSLIDAGAVVVDVREQKQFDHRHIPGAILMPVTLLRQGIPAALEYAKTKNIVVYCGDGVKHGPEGTALLNQAGFTQAVNIEAGIQGWAAAGLPVEK